MKINKNVANFFKTFLIILLWIFVWQIISMAVSKEILVPSPIKTLTTLLTLVEKASFWSAVGTSMLRILLGFLLSVVFGIIGAVLSYRFGAFRALTSPILTLVRTVPVASFIILALVWIKTNYLPVFISFFTVLPIIWDNVLSGIENTDRYALEAAEVDGAGKWTQIFKIIIPQIIPSFFSALVTGLGFAWKSGIAAEVICHPKNSIGGMLIDAKNYLESPEVFALTATVIILSLLIEKLLRHIYSVWAKKHA